MSLSPAEKAKARAEMYSWLSSAFYFPAEEMLQREHTLLLVEISNRLGLDIWDEIEMLERFVDSEPDLQRLNVEYCRLFYGPGPLEAPPYESVYRDGYRLMGDSTMETIRMYQEEGLRVLDSFKDMPDHVSVEMEFMAYLCDKEAEAWENDDEPAAIQHQLKGRAFLEGKLSKWIPEMCELVANAARSEFYLAVSRTARKYIQFEMRELVSTNV